MLYKYRYLNYKILIIKLCSYMNAIFNLREKSVIRRFASSLTYFSLLVTFVLSVIFLTFALYFFNTTSGLVSFISLLFLIFFSAYSLFALAVFVKKVIQLFQSSLASESVYVTQAEYKEFLENGMGSLQQYALITPYWVMFLQLLGWASLFYLGSEIPRWINGEGPAQLQNLVKWLPNYSFLYLIITMQGYVKFLLKLGEICTKPFITNKVKNFIVTDN